MRPGSHTEILPEGYLLESDCWGGTTVLKINEGERPRSAISTEPTHRAALARAWMDYHESRAAEHARIHLEEMQKLNA